MPSSVSPNRNPVYTAVRNAAATYGLDSAFRDICMLLKAPPDLDSCFLVLRNLQYMLECLPAEWTGGNFFPSWQDMTIWALENQATLVESAGKTLEENSRYEIRLGVKVAIHPLLGFGLSKYPIYSTLCNVQELPEQRARYAMLQAQLLVARRRELEAQKASNIESYIDAYENHAGAGDFARNVRQPNSAARAIRTMSAAKSAPMVEFMHPEHRPDRFAFALPRPDFETLPSFVASDRLTSIRHYCGVMTSARPNQVRRPGERMRSVLISGGYIEYSETRFGVQHADGDCDDPALRESLYEIIRDTTIHREETLEADLDPAEMVGPATYILEGVANVNNPDGIPTVHTRVTKTAIDKERMPWSAIHLRPLEIAERLLIKLQATASHTQSSRTASVDLEDLENCALIAVMMETARPLNEASSIRFKPAPDAAFLFVPSARSDKASLWCWKAIEPLYKLARPVVPGKEMIRRSYLTYPVHKVSDDLLRSWRRHSRSVHMDLFREPLNRYEERLKPWLRQLDGTGRLTLSKIARLKWSLLSQESGGDFTEASLVLGRPHPLARVPLFYSLLRVEDASALFTSATRKLWGGRNENRSPFELRARYMSADLEPYTGSRSCPSIDIVRDAIGITKASAFRLAQLDLTKELPDDFIDLFNHSILYLLWHQFYAVAVRGIRMPYTRAAQVCGTSGTVTVADKDSGDGHKTRLLWFPPTLLKHMQQTERIVDEVKERLVVDSDQSRSPIFFLDGDSQAVEIKPKLIEDISREFFPFATNTPRRVMRFLLRDEGMTSEMVEVYMGHWLEQREPWGRWSSFDYGAYLKVLWTHIPRILGQLGFECPPRRSTKRHTSESQI